MRTLSILVVTALAAPAVAGAESDGARLLVGARVGGIVPLAGLSPFVAGGVEVGYVLPIGHRRLAVALAVDYTQPTASGREMDPRVAGGSYGWHLTEQELGVMPLLLYRVTGRGALVPYLGVGPRLLLARSTVTSDGAPGFGDTVEESTEIGVGLPIGAELRLGPGRLTGELLLQYGALDHTATGDSHSGASTLALGYRVFL